MNSDDDRSSVSSESSRPRSIKGSFRKRLKSIGSASDKGRHIIEGTKKAVSSNIVKKALRRRTSSEIRNIQEENIPEDGSIFPASEIFEAIEFAFPPLRRSYSAFDSRTSLDEEDIPPPRYPPPPPPRADMYDDMFSDQSSYSDNLSEKNKHDADGTDAAGKYDLDNDSETSSSSPDDIVKPTRTRNTMLSMSIFPSSSETGSSGNSVEVNSFDYMPNKTAYENWNMATRADNASFSSHPWKSIIDEFDPLYDNVCTTEYDDHLSLSGIDLFCNNSATFAKNNNDDNVTTKESTDSSSPPVHDNHFIEVVSSGEGTKKIKNKYSFRRQSTVSTWSNMKRALEAVSTTSNWSPNVIRRVSHSFHKESGPLFKSSSESMLTKPEIVHPITATLHRGELMKSPSSGDKPKDFVKRTCHLGEGKLYYSPDKDSSKESIELNSVFSVSLMQDHKLSNENEDLYCFEIFVSGRSRAHLFGSLSTTDRRVWMQKILENLTSVFPARYAANYSRAGWCFLKEGIGGAWTPCWILLQKRTLVYSQKDSDKLVEVDLRKARSVGIQEGASSLPTTDGNKQMILLDTVFQSLYLIMGRVSETNEWHRVIRAAAIDNGISLEDQQLTKDDIPVIVDKCVNFIYAHGCMSEGIYRRSGSNSNVTKLLSLFRQDSWSVQISRQEYTEYDVANVLKRFFRDLPEPLLTTELHKHLCEASAVNCSEEDKLSLYRSKLEQLKPVNYVTVRKLIGHLYFIHQEHEKNLMPVANLAAIWGPTLMHVENSESNQWSKRECEALSDLISLYPKLFLVDEEELQRENKIREVLERYGNSNSVIPQSFKPSGDLKVWIYLNSKESGEYVNVSIDPNKCCQSVCEELAPKMKAEPHQLCLQEVICNEALMRPMHHSERVLDTVLRWGYWDEADRKDNYLLLSANSIIREVYPLAKAPLTVSSELKYADRKMKSFKNYLFEFSEAKLHYFKDKKTSSKIKEWPIEDIIWYLGYEPKRDPKTRWSITFIDKSEKPIRSKETPFFGYTIAGINKEEQFKWIAAMLLGKYPQSDLLPPISLLK